MKSISTSLLTLGLVGLGVFAASDSTKPAAPATNKDKVADGKPTEPAPDDFPFPFDEFDGPPPFFGGPQGRGPGGFGGPGGPMRQETKLVAKFDQDGNEWLNATERKAAREWLTKERAAGRGQRGPGPMGAPGRGPGGPGGAFGRRENQTPPQPGPKLTPADVKSYPAAPLFDAQTIRTFFFEFENSDWEKELADFHGSDVEVPVSLAVDGKLFQDVGVHFRGASSFMMVGEGRKRSLSVEVDFAHEDQRLAGYRSFELLNAHEDPTFLRGVLYNQIAREYLPTPKANFARVVINGESWGLYVATQSFNKDFVAEWFGTKKGVRWKVPGRPNGQGGLEYLGDDVAKYRNLYELKSKDDPKAWTDLIQLCRVLNQTPADQLEAALAPLLDIDGALKFLALENVLINSDGYWIRASDYSIYQDPKGQFHIIPHDTNETFSPGGGPGFGGGPGARGPGGSGGPRSFGGPGGPDGPRGPEPGGGPEAGGGKRVNGIELDPLHAANDTKKPLLSKLLAVPALRTRYLGYVREIATTWLDWNKLGPIVEQYRALITDEVKADTRKLDSFDAFTNGITGASNPSAGAEPGPRGPRRLSLKDFAEQRRTFLMKHPALQTGTAAAAAK